MGSEAEPTAQREEQGEVQAAIFGVPAAEVKAVLLADGEWYELSELNGAGAGIEIDSGGFGMTFLRLRVTRVGFESADRLVVPIHSLIGVRARVEEVRF